MKRLVVFATLIVVSLLSSSYTKPSISTISKSLVFPVASKRSFVGSFWGAVRDGGKRKHEGIDIFARKGTPVVAIFDGIIVSRGTTPRGGKVLWLQSTQHSVTAYYAHLDHQKVKAGQFVRKGEVIGTVGTTGNAKYTPPHLHFGIYKYTGAVNPFPYVKNSKKIIVPSVSKKEQPVLAKTPTGKTGTSRSSKAMDARSLSR
jgi:murein DD-endopeptidase MepM/ murein hydrolase activator NlpD